MNIDAHSFIQSIEKLIEKKKFIGKRAKLMNKWNYRFYIARN